MISKPGRLLASLCLAAVMAGASAPQAGAATARLVPRPDLGITVVQLEGEIVPGDAKLVRGLLAAAKLVNSPNRLFVALHSPGGWVFEAMDLGRHLREQGIGTILLPNAVCHSACGYVFWGGYDTAANAPRRIVMAGARLSVHRNFFPADKAALMARAKLEPNQLFQVLQERVAQTLDYLLDLDVSPSTLRRLYGTGRNTAYVLKAQELAADKVMVLEREGTAWALRSGYANAAELPASVKRTDPPASPAAVTERAGAATF